MKCNGKTQNRKLDRNYGRCDICEVVYGSEMVSIQHMLSLKHHKRYETVQRSLGNSVSHFCPVCGIGGIRDISGWIDHICSVPHSSNFDHYLQMSNAHSLYLIVVAPDTIQNPILLEVNHLASAGIGLLTKA
ncbi:hypothetical protein TSMEX_001141 [Taenia solium]|eukprot:TsM_000506300 transcript=TsM_000506300 gene=TsM_000506300